MTVEDLIHQKRMSAALQAGSDGKATLRLILADEQASLRHACRTGPLDGNTKYFGRILSQPNVLAVEPQGGIEEVADARLVEIASTLAPSISPVFDMMPSRRLRSTREREHRRSERVANIKEDRLDGRHRTTDGFAAWIV
jgi:hypothetical protein